jgi:hypothetical protein
MVVAAAIKPPLRTGTGKKDGKTIHGALLPDTKTCALRVVSFR